MEKETWGCVGDVRLVGENDEKWNHIIRYHCKIDHVHSCFGLSRQYETVGSNFNFK